jgi:glycosyltransferase involved in cell wall biosynthesis
VVDAVEAVAARRALRDALAGFEPSAVVLMSTTAALLAPVARLRRRGVEVAVRLDCPAAVNRPGPQNAIQRALERRRLRSASLAIATGPRSAQLTAPLCERVAWVPVGLEVSDADSPATSGDVITYVDDPHTKGLDLVCGAWRDAGGAARGASLHVTGVAPERGRRFLRRAGIAEPESIHWHGPLSREGHLDLLRGCTAYLSASRWEQAGIAQLEALAAGVPLVTTPSRGAYEAEPLARRLAPDLVTARRHAGELGKALAVALAMPADRRSEYAAAAAREVEPFGREAADRTLRDEVLPVLLG